MTKQNDLTGNARLSNTFCHVLSKDHISQLSIFCIARRAQVLRGRGGTQWCLLALIKHIDRYNLHKP
jgi:hypothetical protein